MSQYIHWIKMCLGGRHQSIRARPWEVPTFHRRTPSPLALAHPVSPCFETRPRHCPSRPRLCPRGLYMSHSEVGAPQSGADPGAEHARGPQVCRWVTWSQERLCTGRKPLTCPRRSAVISADASGGKAVRVYKTKCTFWISFLKIYCIHLSRKEGL